MKKILIQLDTDKFTSAFDAIVAYDTGADAVQGYAAVIPPDVRAIILGSFFTRGIPDLKNTAVWIGGSDVDLGEQILAEACRAFFGPFKVSVMLDSNGCNTTACTAIAKLAKQTVLSGKSALVLGPGPVGLRSAALLASEGCRVRMTSIPRELLGSRFDGTIARRTLETAQKAADRINGTLSSGGAIAVSDVDSLANLNVFLENAEIVIAAGPAGLRILPREYWANRRGIRWLLDFNLAEPLGIEGVMPGDDFAEHGGIRCLGALAIGNPKMKVHKACLAQLFEKNDQVFDTEGIYKVARQVIE